MKNGFTLIELLAVIVILAIIALIAVPIVLNIINDSKESSLLRSAEFYLDAVEYMVAQLTLKDQNISDGTYNIMKSGNICLETFNTTSKECVDSSDEGTDIDILKVEVNGEHPKEGTITISGGEILHSEVKLNEKEIIKNSKGEIAYAKTLEEVCELKSGTAKTAGAKYECKVDPNKDPYTFYVLTTPLSTDERINLIMAQNINSDGTPITKAIQESQKDANGGIYNLVAWVSKADYNDDTNYGTSGNNNKGPITAMKFLSAATKTWTNVNELIIDSFTDNTGASYDMQTYNTYARMPYKSEVSGYDSTNKTNAYLYDYLNQFKTIQTNAISGIYGYWTLFSDAVVSSNAWYVTYNGYVYYYGLAGHSGGFGVRPVITLKI